MIVKTLAGLVSALVAVALIAIGPVPAAHAATDPLLADQWALTSANAPAAWSVARGAGVKIGIVDTGVDLQHEDLRTKVVASADCTVAPCATGPSAGADDNGHGTHVAGIAAAVTGNDIGIAGVAPDTSIIVAKALDQRGQGTLQAVDRSIRWVVDQGAHVVNLSLGSDLPVLFGLLPGDSLGPAISYAWNKGAVPVIASGNDSTILGTSNYRQFDAIVVGATGPNGGVASYSSAIDAKYGIVAPGGDGDCAGAGAIRNCVVSTYHVDGYALAKGTSMAAPHVSGAVALLIGQGLNRDQAVRRVLDTANSSVSCGPNCAGRLDVGAAVGAGAASPPPGEPASTAGPGDTTPSGSNTAPPDSQGSGNGSPSQGTAPSGDQSSDPDPTTTGGPQGSDRASGPERAPAGSGDGAGAGSGSPPPAAGGTPPAPTQDEDIAPSSGSGALQQPAEQGATSPALPPFSSGRFPTGLRSPATAAPTGGGTTGVTTPLVVAPVPASSSPPPPSHVPASSEGTPPPAALPAGGPAEAPVAKPPTEVTLRIEDPNNLGQRVLIGLGGLGLMIGVVGRGIAIRRRPAPSALVAV